MLKDNILMLQGLKDRLRGNARPVLPLAVVH